MSETRTITVKGDASIFRVGADSPPNAKITRRRARAVRDASLPTVFIKMGGAAAPESATATVAAPANAPATPVTGSKAATNGGISNAPVTSSKAATNGGISNAPATATVPAQSSSRVVLGGKKPKVMKVVLTKKNHGSASASEDASTSTSGHKKHRKVTLGIQHLKRRVTKARRLNKITKALSFDQIKKELLSAKIIKEDSKAPESILRQMYADAKLITTKSL